MKTTFNWPANPTWTYLHKIYKHQLTFPASSLNFFKQSCTCRWSGVVTVWCVVSCLFGISNSSKSLSTSCHSLVFGSRKMPAIFLMCSALKSKQKDYTHVKLYSNFFLLFQVLLKVGIKFISVDLLVKLYLPFLLWKAI